MLRLLRQNSDGRAVRRVLNGDGEAFGHLVDRYGRAALAVARAIAPFQAEDALQEAYVLAYRRLDTLEQPHRFGPWLISITRNVALRLRERTRETAPLEHAPEAALSTAPTPERTEIRAVVRHALDGLDAAHREVLLLHYFAGNSVAEIATMLEISTDAAKKRLQRARESLSTDLLRALGAESAEAYGLTPRRRKQIVAAALAGGAAWQGQAHAAAVATASTGAVSLVVKAVVSVVAVGGIVTGAFLYQQAESEPAAPVAPANAANSTQSAAPAVAASGKPDEAALLAAFMANGALPTGPGTIEAMVTSIDGNVVAGATALLERVTWKARDTPPARVPTWTSLSDDNGKIRFENLPPGDYSLIAYTETAGTAEAAYVDESSPSDTSNNMVLMPLVQMSGRVVNSEGEPVANATIYPISHELSGDDIFNAIRVAATRVTSGEDGTYTFDRCWPGKMRFFVAAEGYAPYMSDWVQTSDSPTFTLDPGGTIDLTLVREPGGEPMAGIPLTLFEPESNRLSMEGVTGPDGTIHFERVAPGNYLPELNDAALVLLDSATISMAALEQKVITLRMGAGATIFGKVFDTDTQKPLAGMVVYAQGEANINREAVTADDGTYMLIGVPGGRVHVGVSGVAGDSMRQYSAGAPGYIEGNSASRQISVSPGAILGDVNFDMRRALVVSGRVVDESGVPLAGASVHVRPVACDESSQYSLNRDTDDTGVFVFENLPKQCKFEIIARNATGISRLVPLNPESATDIVLTLSPDGGTLLAGDVVALDGKPVLAGSVIITYANELSISKSINAGKVDFGMVPLGKASYTVYQEAPGGMNLGCPSVPFDLAPGTGLVRQKFTCGTPGGLTLSGRVLLPDGAPAAGAEVSLVNVPFKTTASARGEFTLEGITDSDGYSVQASLQGYTASSPIQARGGDDDLTLQLLPLVQLAGRVLDAGTGAPIAGARITLQQYIANRSVSRSATSAADGGFAFDGVSLGYFSLETTAPGYANNSYAYNIAEDIAIPEIVIKLAAPARVAGVVFDAGGAPIAGVTLEAASSGMRTTSNTDGTFEFNGMESGVASVLTVSHTDHGKIAVEVVPGSPGSEELTITMPVPPTLEVIATLDGVPLPSYDVSGYTMEAPGRSSFHVRANSTDGRVMVREVSAGTWNINIRHDGGGGTEINQTAVLTSGQVTTVTAAFQTGTASLRGQFFSGFGNPAMQRHAHLKNLEAGRTGHPVHIEVDNYRVENVAPGDYVITIFGGEMSFQRIQRRVRIADGEDKEFDIVVDGSASVTFTHNGNVDEGMMIMLTNSKEPPDPAQDTDFADATDCEFYTVPIQDRATLSGIAPGDYWLSAIPMSSVVVPPGGTAPEPVYQRVHIAPGDANEFEVGD